MMEEAPVTPDLTLLVWTVALTVVQLVAAVMGASGQVGLATLAGNREGLADPTGWVGRAQRAHLNMLQSLPLFAALVLTAHVAGKVDGTVILGAQLFFWARLVYAIVYTAGIPWVRTLVWAVSVVGLVLIFLRLV
jgi:uncharacterized MAPEG superfamily protein